MSHVVFKIQFGLTYIYIYIYIYIHTIKHMENQRGHEKYFPDGAFSMSLRANTVLSGR